jgi:hypothetical protein
MKHKVKVKVPVEKRGLFGIKKTVMETRTIEVDGKTYKKMQQEKKNRPNTMKLLKMGMPNKQVSTCKHNTLLKNL